MTPGGHFKYQTKLFSLFFTEPSSVLNLNQDDQGVNMTIGAMEVVTDPKPGTSRQLIGKSIF